MSLGNQSGKRAAELWKTGPLPRIPQPQQPRRPLSTFSQDLTAQVHDSQNGDQEVAAQTCGFCFRESLQVNGT